MGGSQSSLAEPAPPIPQTKSPAEEYFTALHDYQKSAKNHISIKRGDKLELISDKDPYWWEVKNQRSDKCGFVPFNFIRPDKPFNYNSKSWFFPEITRLEAERLLEYLDNEPGVFLVRESEREKGNALVLSVLCEDWKIMHYLIRRTPDGCIKHNLRNKESDARNLKKNNNNEYTFAHLDHLISYYKSKKMLSVKLKRPCQKPEVFDGYDIWEEQRINIELIQKIAEGNFGEVYIGKWRKRHTVAVKVIKFNRNDRAERESEFLKELQINKKLKHEKIVKLWCVCTIDEPILLVTEYMCNGDLLKYLRTDAAGPNKIQFRHIIDMAIQIAAGMKYLEASHCVHRDLAARNILVGERNIVKIADFGLAQMLDKNSNCIDLSRNDVKMPVRWTAPEAITIDPITRKRQYTIKSDVWSYGIVLYELITKGEVPYKGMSNSEVIHEVKNEMYRMPKPTANGLCDDFFYEIMLKCWHDIQTLRPTFEWLYNTFNDFTTSAERPYDEA